MNFLKTVKTLEIPWGIPKPVLPSLLWKCPRPSNKKELLIIQGKTSLSQLPASVILNNRYLSDFHHSEGTAGPSQVLSQGSKAGIGYYRGHFLFGFLNGKPKQTPKHTRFKPKSRYQRDQRQGNQKCRTG